jgi:hypothetical protein
MPRSHSNCMQAKAQSADLKLTAGQRPFVRSHNWDFKVAGRLVPIFLPHLKDIATRNRPEPRIIPLRFQPSSACPSPRISGIVDLPSRARHGSRPLSP